MNTETLDTLYQQMELFCLQKMQEFGMPASLMTYVVARLLANVESMHICEKSQTPAKEQVQKDEEINLGIIPENIKNENLQTGDK